MTFRISLAASHRSIPRVYSGFRAVAVSRCLGTASIYGTLGRTDESPKPEALKAGFTNISNMVKPAGEKSKISPETIKSVEAVQISKSTLDKFLTDSILVGLTNIPIGTTSDQVKKEMQKLILQKQYDSLLKLLVKWTLQKKTHWQEILTHGELSYILSLLVEYQIGLITKAATQRMIRGGTFDSQLQLKHSHDFRERLRAVYSNLTSVESDLKEHLYSKARTMGTAQPRGMVNLSSKDYENLIKLELNNGKLDLASKWFQHMEQQYPFGTHYKVMTYELWILKFQVYGGASSAMWKVEPNDLYEKEINPRQSSLKSEMLWMEIFNDYVTNQSLLLGTSEIIFENRLVCALLASVAYSNNVKQVCKLIELNWGLDKDGKLIGGFKISPDSPVYPNLEVVRTVAVAMMFNREFLKCLKYINGFQEHYAIDLKRDQHAKHFWDQLFRWCELTTRFSEYRAFHHYIRETGISVLIPKEAEELELTLEEAKKSVQFDYEGYLKFVSDLSGQRTGLIEEVWKCYRQTDPGFSARPYKTVLTMLKENPQEEQLYEYLGQLSGEYDRHHQIASSFNASASKDKRRQIFAIYAEAMKVLINVKGESGQMGQIRALVNEWSLDETMVDIMMKWATLQEERYLEVLHREVKEEEDDEFLGII